MAADVTIDYEAMENAASRLTSTSEQMTTEMTTLRTMVDSLVESGFKTDMASENFREGFTEFNNGVTQTLKGLDVMAKFLTNYVNTQREIDAQMKINVQGQ